MTERRALVNWVDAHITDLVEIRPGEFKQLGDCTADDLKAAAALLTEKAELLEQNES
jgi:hypothetical protein